ncbi:hypothetical protein MTR67_026238 [Solanum verrucosum]|uniref:Uncharacterized protein n=1 Tax=Solanum verrucosum TaxID=315347 RepID=A0AAF0R2D8_SOLVR|nr:hypothetical protein MTR67_026238 [Solanum verrucosum]
MDCLSNNSSVGGESEIHSEETSDSSEQAEETSDSSEQAEGVFTPKGRDLELMEVEQVLLKVSPMKGKPKAIPRGAPRAVVLATSSGACHDPCSLSWTLREVCKLREKEIASVKGQWKNCQVEESTSETEDDMHKIYPHLFVGSGTLSFPRLSFDVRYE